MVRGTACTAHWQASMTASASARGCRACCVGGKLSAWRTCTGCKGCYERTQPRAVQEVGPSSCSGSESESWPMSQGRAGGSASKCPR